jgi:hypothetical protein
MNLDFGNDTTEMHLQLVGQIYLDKIKSSELVFILEIIIFN